MVCGERLDDEQDLQFMKGWPSLVKWPDECNDTKGKPVTSKIVSKIKAEANLFWPNSIPPLSKETMTDHLGNWIKKTNNRK